MFIKIKPLENKWKLKSDMEKKEPKKEYNKSQCVYGQNSKMHCTICSAMCRERYEDFKECGIKVTFI